jgi:hypothetical protein
MDERVKSVFDILEAVEMPKQLRYRLKESVRSAMQNGANFGGVVVATQKIPHDKGKSTGVLHLWRISETGAIIPLTIKLEYTEGDDAQ